MHCYTFLVVQGDFKSTGSQVVWCTCNWYFVYYIWFKYNLGWKYCTPQVQPNRASNSWPPDRGSTFHSLILCSDHSAISVCLVIVCQWNVTCHNLLLRVLLQHCFIFLQAFCDKPISNGGLPNTTVNKVIINIKRRKRQSTK